MASFVFFSLTLVVSRLRPICCRYRCCRCCCCCCCCKQTVFALLCAGGGGQSGRVVCTCCGCARLCHCGRLCQGRAQHNAADRPWFRRPTSRPANYQTSKPIWVCTSRPSYTVRTRLPLLLLTPGCSAPAGFTAPRRSGVM